MTQERAVTATRRHELRQRPENVQTPPVDVYENDSAYVLFVDLPGVKPEGVDIQLEQDRLTVRGRLEGLAREPSYAEFPVRDYYRSFQVLDDIDPDRVRASLEDGVLRLELPKSARARTRRIQVQAE